MKINCKKFYLNYISRKFHFGCLIKKTPAYVIMRFNKYEQTFSPQKLK